MLSRRCDATRHSRQQVLRHCYLLLLLLYCPEFTVTHAVTHTLLTPFGGAEHARARGSEDGLGVLTTCTKNGVGPGWVTPFTMRKEGLGPI